MRTIQLPLVGLLLRNQNRSCVHLSRKWVRTPWSDVQPRGLLLNPSDVIDAEDLKLLQSEFQKSRQMKAQRVQWYNYAHATGLVQQQESLESLSRSYSELSRISEEREQTCKGLIAAQQTILLALTGQASAQVCLHEGFVGVVDEVSAQQITVQYDRKDDPDGPSIMQRYQHQQILAGCSLHEGDEVEAHVFVTVVRHPSVPPPASAIVEDPYSGFSHRWQSSNPEK